MEKYLPIKFFEKRVGDERNTEGMGGGDDPKFYLRDDALAERAAMLTRDVSVINDSFKKYETEEHVMPMVMATTISGDALAKSHRGAISNLLNSDNNENVIGVDTTMEDYVVKSKKKKDADMLAPEIESRETLRILSVVTTSTLIDNINRALSQKESNVAAISAITEMEKFEPMVAEYNPENHAYRVKLHDYHSKKENMKAQASFEEHCNEADIRIEHKTRYSKDMQLYRISLDSVEAMERIQGLDMIYSIEEAVPVRPDDESMDTLPSVSPKKPEEDKDYPVVGVLDSGIEHNPFYEDWILPDGEVFYPAHLQSKEHGSMVAGILEYSDELNGTDYFATDGVMMLEAVVAPDFKKANVYMEDILDDARSTIEKHKDIKIWTMSLGTGTECAKGSFSVFGSILDEIEDENDVLIIKSAGNTDAFLYGYPNERIAQSADSVRSLVVGSIARKKDKGDLADPGLVSPFSRIGPGPQSIIKPDLVAYGGNAGIDTSGKLVPNGEFTIDSAGSISKIIGTSFSTPWVARVASELVYLLDEDFDPLLIKALMIHNADYPAGQSMSMSDKYNTMGFGMPKGAREILYNSENEITLILRDTLRKGEFIEVLDFPFPDSLIGSDGFYHGHVTVTAVCDSILRNSDGPEYCQSNLEIIFGTMDRIKPRAIEKRNIRNPYGPEGTFNILSGTGYSQKYGKHPSDDEFANERLLIRYGKKYHPIKKYAVNLDDLTEGNRKNVSADKKWYMKLQGFYRDATEQEFMSNGEILEQRFCLMITISDPTGNAKVYTDVTQQLEDKGFNYSNVELKNEIRQHVGESEDGAK